MLVWMSLRELIIFAVIAEQRQFNSLQERHFALLLVFGIERRDQLLVFLQYKLLTWLTNIIWWTILRLIWAMFVNFASYIFWNLQKFLIVLCTINNWRVVFKSLFKIVINCTIKSKLIITAIFNTGVYVIPWHYKIKVVFERLFSNTYLFSATFCCWNITLLRYHGKVTIKIRLS